MVVAERMDDCGKAAWIGATILGFWLFWPIGVAVLVFLCWTGRLRSWRMERAGRWHNAPPGEGPWAGCGWRARRRNAPSGNAAFDDYRAETLRRLEEEQKEFVDYLDRLRRAKDKQEFDEFMAERRRAGQAPDAPAAS